MDDQEPSTVDAAGTTEVAVPYPYSQYVCPQCGKTIHHKALRTLGRPPQAQAQLNLVMRCPFCRYFFSPRSTAPQGGLVTAGAEEVSVVGGAGYTCPGCGHEIATAKVRAVRRPAKHAANLNLVIRCPRPECLYVFSPRPAGRVLRA